MLHLNSYHAIWGVLSCEAVHMKLPKTSEMTGQTSYIRSLNKRGKQNGKDTIYIYFGKKAHPKKFFVNHPEVAQLLPTKQLFTVATSSPRLPKFSTCF